MSAPMNYVNLGKPSLKKIKDDTRCPLVAMLLDTVRGLEKVVRVSPHS